MVGRFSAAKADGAIPSKTGPLHFALAPITLMSDGLVWVVHITLNARLSDLRAGGQGTLDFLATQLAAKLQLDRAALTLTVQPGPWRAVAAAVGVCVCHDGWCGDELRWSGCGRVGRARGSHQRR